MTAALTSPSDIEVALVRPLTTTESQFVGGLIDQASALLRTAAPSVDARIATWQADPTVPSGLDPMTVASVLAGVIKRYLVNPTGVVSTSDSTGPYAHSEAWALRSDKDRRGALEITPEDLNVLFPTRKRIRAGTIRTRAALAPRPVGRYGPLPSIPEAINAVITYDDPQTVDLDSGFRPQ